MPLFFPSHQKTRLISVQFSVWKIELFLCVFLVFSLSSSFPVFSSSWLPPSATQLKVFSVYWAFTFVCFIAYYKQFCRIYCIYKGLEETCLICIGKIPTVPWDYNKYTKNPYSITGLQYSIVYFIYHFYIRGLKYNTHHSAVPSKNAVSANIKHSRYFH